mmetsp:Transcript_15845/g.28128  ORF Transcript_15845/g.28128 Transcript_15845/m.28128 type:complete len:551 (-) Transcript_15845:110-1762(-)
MFSGEQSYQFRQPQQESSRRHRGGSRFKAAEEGPAIPRIPPPFPGAMGNSSGSGDYASAVAKCYQEYAAAMMKPEYSAQWSQLAYSFWQGQNPASSPLPGAPLCFPGASGMSAPPPQPNYREKAYSQSTFRPRKTGLGSMVSIDEYSSDEQAAQCGRIHAADADKEYVTKRQDDSKHRKPVNRPVVSPFQRNAVFGVDGMLVTGRNSSARSGKSLKTKGDTCAAESSGGKGRDFSIPSTRSTDTGPEENQDIVVEENQDTSNDTGRGGGKAPSSVDFKSRKLYPYMHPTLTKSLVGEANFHSLRSLILQQQQMFSQQVQQLHHAVDVQQRLASESKTSLKEASFQGKPAAEPTTGESAGKSGDPCILRQTAPVKGQRRSPSSDLGVSHDPDYTREHLSGIKRKGVQLHGKEDRDGMSKTQRHAGDDSLAPSLSRRGLVSRSPASGEAESPREMTRKDAMPLADDLSAAREYEREYAAAAAAFSYNSMLHNMASSGAAMPFRMPLPSGSAPFPMASPQIMEYFASMQNPSWYSAYVGASGLSPGHGPEYQH